MLAGGVPRRQCDASDGTLGHVFDVLDVLDLVVGIADAPQDVGAEREGDQQQEPRDEVLDEVCSLGWMSVIVQWAKEKREHGPVWRNATHLDGIHAERHRSTGRLDTLVVAGHTGELERLVGDGRHGVVGETLEHGIGQVVGQQQYDGPRRDADRPVPGDLDAADGGVGAGELDLECKAGPPDDAVQNGNGGRGHECTLPAAAGQVVSELADDDGPQD